MGGTLDLPIAGDDRLEHVARARAVTYSGMAVGLLLLCWIAARTDWSGYDELHLLIEAVSSVVALTVSAMAFTCYYSRPEAKFLWLATAFFGAGLLDVYHAALTTWLAAVYLPGMMGSAVQWSEFLPRLYLAALFCLSCWPIKVLRRPLEAADNGARRIFLISFLLFLGLIVFISSLDVTFPVLSDSAIPRPLFLLPAVLFGLSLIGYLKKGLWRERERKFDHWTIQSLILAIAGNAGMMGFSVHPLDAGHEAGHLAKLLGYLCILVGL
jgi:hypothetical protein